MNEGTRPRNQASDGRGHDPDLNSPATSSNLTVAGPVHLGEDTIRARGGRSAPGTAEGKKQKICCACGKDVAHEERFKDRAGFYWCMDCGVQENRKKHTIGHAPEPMQCHDCSEPFPAEQLVNHDDIHLCPGCLDKRLKAAEREAARQTARKAAIERELIETERRRRRMLIISSVIAAIAVAWAVYVIAS